jgi:hypothetical protein
VSRGDARVFAAMFGPVEGGVGTVEGRSTGISRTQFGQSA